MARKLVAGLVVLVALFAAGCKSEEQRKQEAAERQMFGFLFLVVAVVGGGGYVLYRLNLPKEVVMQERALREKREARAHDRKMKNKEIAGKILGPVTGVVFGVLKKKYGG